GHISRFEAALRVERGIVPGLRSRVSLRTAALEIECETEKTASPPVRHGRDEFVGIALGIPLVSVGIGPARASRRIRIAEDALDGAHVHQQAFDTQAAPRASSICGLAIEDKIVPADRDFGTRSGGAERGRTGE